MDGEHGVKKTREPRVVTNVQCIVKGDFKLPKLEYRYVYGFPGLVVKELDKVEDEIVADLKLLKELKRKVAAGLRNEGIPDDADLIVTKDEVICTWQEKAY